MFEYFGIDCAKLWWMTVKNLEKPSELSTLLSKGASVTDL